MPNRMRPGPDYFHRDLVDVGAVEERRGGRVVVDVRGDLGHLRHQLVEERPPPQCASTVVTSGNFSRKL